MKTFEYLHTTNKDIRSDPNDHHTEFSVSDGLNKLGSEGWELIHIRWIEYFSSSHDDLSHYRYIFKRETTNDN